MSHHTPSPYLPVGKLPPDVECARCFRCDIPLRPDPEIDEVWFCEPCWQERERVTQTHAFGYDNDIGEE